MNFKNRKKWFVAIIICMAIFSCVKFFETSQTNIYNKSPLYFNANETRINISFGLLFDGNPLLNLKTEETDCNILKKIVCNKFFESNMVKAHLKSEYNVTGRARITLSIKSKFKDLVLLEPIFKLSSNKKIITSYIGGQEVYGRISFRNDPYYKKPPEIPTIFAVGKDFSFGTMLRDNFSRLNHDAFKQFGSNNVFTKIKNNGIKPNGEQIFYMDIFSFDKSIKSDNFYKLLRSEYPAVEISGAIDFFNIFKQKKLLNDPDRLRKYFIAHSIDTLIMVPWLDYDHYNPSSDSFLTRQTYFNEFSDAIEKIRAVRKNIKLVGALQSNLYTPSLKVQKIIIQHLEQEGIKSGFQKIPLSLLSKNLIMPRKINELVVDENGNVPVEVYFNGPNDIIGVALATAITEGSSQLFFLNNQIEFLVNKVGLDGFYIDQLSLAFNSKNPQRYDFGKWDGRTIVLSEKTEDKYTYINDLALSTIKAKKELLEKSLDRGLIIVANTPPATDIMAELPIPRFFEAFWRGMNYINDPDGKPPAWSSIMATRLSSPLGLLAPNWMKQFVDQDFLFTNLIFNLKNGVIPVYNGSASREKYIELPNFFPGTFKNVGEGFVLSDKKLIAAKTMNIPIDNKTIVAVKFFDKSGLILENKARRAFIKSGLLQVFLDDWSEIVEVQFK